MGLAGHPVKKRTTPQWFERLLPACTCDPGRTDTFSIHCRVHGIAPSALRHQWAIRKSTNAP
jgi:hypothetical protein